MGGARPGAGRWVRAVLVWAVLVAGVAWTGSVAPAAAATRPQVTVSSPFRSVMPYEHVTLSVVVMPLPGQAAPAGTLRLTGRGPSGELEVTSVDRPDGRHTFVLSSPQCCSRRGTWTFVVEYLPSTPAFVRSSSETVTITWDDRNYFPDFVEAVYRDIVLRPSDRAGKDYWVDRLRRGDPRYSTALTFLATTEALGRQVSAIHEQVLDRPATNAELQRFVPRLAAGTTVEQVEAEVIGGAEFWAASGSTTDGFVRRMYLRQLRREPDADGAAFFRSRLGPSPTTAERVWAGGAFSYSTERLRWVVNGYYVRLLHRDGEPAGVDHWVARIQSGSRDELVIALVTASDEYYDRNQLVVGG